MSDLRAGTIVFLDNENQLGVIEDENAQDIMFELQDLPKRINVYDMVSFEIAFSDDGLKAINITPH